MHLRDQNLQAEQKWALRRRLFGVNAQAELATAPSAPIPGPAIVPSDATDNAEARSSTTPASSLPTSQSSLRSLTSRLMNMVNDDSDDAEEPELLQDNAVPSGEDDPVLKQRIKDLFNLDANHWVASAQQSTVGSLEDEMDYYDLLTLDAAGEEENLDYDVDDSIESVFTS